MSVQNEEFLGSRAINEINGVRFIYDIRVVEVAVYDIWVMEVAVNEIQVTGWRCAIYG